MDCLIGKKNFALTTRCRCPGLSLSRRQRPTRGSKVLHSQPDDVTRGLKDCARRKRRDVKKATRGQNLGHDARGDAQLSLQPSTTHNQARSHNGTCLTLVATMARALFDPYRSQFVIGTIGSSVAAGHVNCHYNSYATIMVKTPPIGCSL